jgi:hypothetical protein
LLTRACTLHSCQRKMEQVSTHGRALSGKRAVHQSALGIVQNRRIRAQRRPGRQYQDNLLVGRGQGVGRTGPAVCSASFSIPALTSFVSFGQSRLAIDFANSSDAILQQCGIHGTRTQRVQATKTRSSRSQPDQFRKTASRIAARVSRCRTRDRCQCIGSVPGAGEVR